MTDPNKNYVREVEITCKDEVYLVRDNGAVYRKSNPQRRRSKWDEIWTFGALDQNGYNTIGAHKVHQIVAQAYLGTPTEINAVVDHVDRHKTNNRPENLRWISRLDNLIRHPSTRKLIILAYGSLENFFKNPKAVINPIKSIQWLTKISRSEAQHSKAQLQEWATSDGRSPEIKTLVNRVYGVKEKPPEYSQLEQIPEQESLTPGAIQRNWKTPTEFLCCPTYDPTASLSTYAQRLQPGLPFSQNRYSQTQIVLAEQKEAVISVVVKVIDSNSVKPYAVTKITQEDHQFIHEAMGTFFELDGAKARHYEILGVPFEYSGLDNL